MGHTTQQTADGQDNGGVFHTLGHNWGEKGCQPSERVRDGKSKTGRQSWKTLARLKIIHLEGQTAEKSNTENEHCILEAF